MKAAARNVDVFDLVLCSGVGLVVLVVSAGAALEGRHLAAKQEAADAQTLVTEDRDVCLRLAAGPDTDRFSRCVIELSGVRGEERRRVAARTAALP